MGHPSNLPYICCFFDLPPKQVAFNDPWVSPLPPQSPKSHFLASEAPNNSCKKTSRARETGQLQVLKISW